MMLLDNPHVKLQTLDQQLLTASSRLLHSQYLKSLTAFSRVLQGSPGNQAFLQRRVNILTRRSLKHTMLQISERRSTSSMELSAPLSILKRLMDPGPGEKPHSTTFHFLRGAACLSRTEGSSRFLAACLLELLH